MRNMVLGMLVVACVMACGEVVGAAKTGKIVDETVIFELSEDIGRRENAGVGSMRLSPDGTKLLFIRRQGADRTTRSYRLVLRDIKGGKDRELKIAGYDQDDLAAFMLAGNVFDPAGKRLALGVAVDANKNGRHDFGGDDPEQMQAVLYDLATDKATKIGLSADIVLASFDRTGKGLVLITADKEAAEGKMYVTPVDPIKLRPFGLWGVPRGICPAVDVMGLLLPPTAEARAAGKRPQPEMGLFDLAKGKMMLKLPVREHNTKLDDYCPQWTADGRYLYYIGVDREPRPGGGTRRKYESRIWDRVKSQSLPEVPGVVPVGPGPTAGTMVLAPYRTVDKLMVHDAKVDKAWPVDGPALRPIGSEGKYILYVRSGKEGKDVLCRGQIKLPAT